MNGNMSEPAEWLRDGDSQYIGARRLGREVARAMTVYIDPFFALSHGAFERYLKGILSAIDGTHYSERKLKAFDHSLDKLLRAVRSHQKMEANDLDWATKILDSEWKHARYLVSADPQQLMGDAGSFGFAHLDSIVPVLRNRLIGYCTASEINDSILVQLWGSGIPFENLREAFVGENDSLAAFAGLPQ